MEVSARGDMLACGDVEGMLAMWNLRTGRPLRRVRVVDEDAFPGGVSALAFSPDGKTLASHGGRGPIRFWDVATGRRHRTVATGESVTRLTFDPTGRTMAVAERGLRLGPDRRPDPWFRIALWHQGSNELARGPIVEHDDVVAASFSPDGGTLAACGREGIMLWDPRDLGAGPRARYPNFPRLYSAAYSRDGAPLASIGTHGAIMVALAGGERLLAACCSNVVELWELPAGRAIRRMEPHSGGVASVAFSPDGTIIATGGSADDPTCKLWELGSGRRLHTLDNGTESVLGLAFSANGKYLATRGGVARLWDVETGQLQRTLAQTGHRVVDVAMPQAPQAPRPLLATLGEEGTLIVWDFMSGQVVSKFRDVASAAPRSLAISPDGSIIVKATGDGPLRLLDPVRGATVATLYALPPSGAGSTDPAWLTLTPSGHYAGSAAAERYLRWKVNGRLLPGEAYMDQYRKPDVVTRALSGRPYCDGVCGRPVEPLALSLAPERESRRHRSRTIRRSPGAPIVAWKSGWRFSSVNRNPAFS